MTEARNTRRVPKSEWKKWSPIARRTFNSVYDFLLSNQDLITHPKAEVATPFHWKTVSWNAAWIAADAVDGKLPTEVIEMERTVSKGKEVFTEKSRKKVKTSRRA